MKNVISARACFWFFGGLCLVIACLGSTTVRAQTASYVLGTRTLAVVPASGSYNANINLLGQEITVTQAATLPPSPMFTGAQWLGGGGIQLSGTTSGGATLTLLTSTDLGLPLNQWTICGTVANEAGGSFQFTPQPPTNGVQHFYIIRSSQN
ncbi:MAG TPA: hypothetical protein VGO67_21480 [Verrucomicrobiae bacterium]